MPPKIPEEIKKILDKPPRRTEEEIKIIRNWLDIPPQHDEILALAQKFLRKIRPTATEADATKTWDDFRNKKLDKRMIEYDHDKGCTFWNYLIYKRVQNWDSFENFCYNTAKKIPNRIVWDFFTDSKYPHISYRIVLEFFTDPNNPEEFLIKKEIFDKLYICLNKLESKKLEVIIMKYFEEKSIKEISKKLAITISNTKALLFHGRHILNDLLRKEGLDKDDVMQIF